MDGNSVRSLKEYIDQTDDLELNAKLTIVEKYASRIPELLIQLRSCSEPDLHRAGVQSLTHTHTQCVQHIPLIHRVDLHWWI